MSEEQNNEQDESESRQIKYERADLQRTPKPKFIIEEESLGMKQAPPKLMPPVDETPQVETTKPEPAKPLPSVPEKPKLEPTVTETPQPKTAESEPTKSSSVADEK